MIHESLLSQVVASIPCRHKHSPAFFHSFGLSDDYLIFIEQPLYADAGDWKNGHQGGIGSAGNKRLRWKRNDMVKSTVVTVFNDIFGKCKKTCHCNQQYFVTVSRYIYFLLSKSYSVVGK